MHSSTNSRVPTSFWCSLFPLELSCSISLSLSVCSLPNPGITGHESRRLIGNPIDNRRQSLSSPTLAYSDRRTTNPAPQHLRRPQRSVLSVNPMRLGPNTDAGAASPTQQPITLSVLASPRLPEVIFYFGGTSPASRGQSRGVDKD
ncbi:unnamed protein product [Linum trigynum]|uniref:Uncharacterized protein n=1 Tax=Linum trigynum TaxID=586398 RepID=A0AAV2CXV7_9ROSI